MCSVSGQQDGSGFSTAGWPRMPARRQAGGCITQDRTTWLLGKASHRQYVDVLLANLGVSSYRLGTARPGGIKLHAELSYLLSLPMQFMLDASALTARLMWPSVFPVIIFCLAGVSCSLGKYTTIQDQKQGVEEHTLLWTNHIACRFLMQAGICTALAMLHDIVALACLPATLASAAMSALYRTHLMCMTSTWKMLRGRYGKGATKPGVSGIRRGQPEDLQKAPGVEAMLGKPKGIQVWRVWNIQLSQTGYHPSGCSGNAGKVSDIKFRSTNLLYTPLLLSGASAGAGAAYCWCPAVRALPGLTAHDLHLVPRVISAAHGGAVSAAIGPVQPQLGCAVEPGLAADVAAHTASCLSRWCIACCLGQRQHGRLSDANQPINACLYAGRILVEAVDMAIDDIKPDGRREPLNRADSRYYRISMQPLSYMELLRAWPVSASGRPGENARAWLAGNLASKHC